MAHCTTKIWNLQQESTTDERYGRAMEDLLSTVSDDPRIFGSTHGRIKGHSGEGGP